jgi:hypothetical protein
MLSENEKKILAEIENSLKESDPNIAEKLNPVKKSTERAFIYFSLVILGMVVIFIGLLNKTPLLGVIGFSISLIGLAKAIKILSVLKENKFIIS